MNIVQERNNRQVARWLMIGVIMIIIQVLIGGITRLTESGLSITEWKPITGALPPLNEADWLVEFEKYKTTDQFKYVNNSFTLSDFKFIFFWEWFHRQWARLIGVVFLVGFVYLLARRKFTSNMILPMLFLFLLGGLQGTIGWVMVKSGLVPEKFYVGHIELTTHFIAAMLLLCFTLWYCLRLLPSFQQKVHHPGAKRMLIWFLAILSVQLVYGGFMAGLKAAASAPTWPKINQDWIPDAVNDIQPWASNLVNNNLMVHLIHRSLAYILLIVGFVFYSKYRTISTTLTFTRLRIGFIILLVSQVMLGIFTVLNATNPTVLTWMGVMHQFTAMLLLMCVVSLLFVVKRAKLEPA
jgi:heme a synthase